jgi:hypothetical protein
VRACPTGSWVFTPFFQVFLDMLCSTPAFSLCGISKSTFHHPIEGHRVEGCAFAQPEVGGFLPISVFPVLFQKKTFCLGGFFSLF